MEFVIRLAIALSQGSLALLVATATIIGLLAVRSNHLSERARATIDEALYKVPTIKNRRIETKRIYSLTNQAITFIERYYWCSWTICLLVFCFLTIFIASVSFLDYAPNEHPDEITSLVATFSSSPQALIHFAGLGAAMVAGGLICVGLFALTHEFRRGYRTLLDNLHVLLIVLNDNQPTPANSQTQSADASQSEDFFECEFTEQYRLPAKTRTSHPFKEWSPLESFTNII